MWLWNAWFNPNSFYSYCSVVPLISGIIAYNNLKSKKPPGSMVFPAAFLLFMFPLPAAITGPLSFHLKYFSAGLSTGILNLLTVSSVQLGNVIVMSQGSVVVNDACSGIRAIISLLAMGSVFAYYMESSLDKKLWLMVMVLPIALLTNSLRIVFLALITQFWGARHIAGPVHDFAGLMIYGLSFIFLWLISRKLTVKTI
jgi:exosortase